MFMSVKPFSPLINPLAATQKAKKLELKRSNAQHSLEEPPAKRMKVVHKTVRYPDQIIKYSDYAKSFEGLLKNSDNSGNPENSETSEINSEINSENSEKYSDDDSFDGSELSEQELKELTKKSSHKERK